jgi:poly-gamma-glutamate synthesis protein (capsule biosynthesis protein)
MDADEQFDLVRPILRAGDVTFGQLETPLSNRNAPLRPGGEPRQSLDPDAGAKTLVSGGFDIMSFAGNHTSDMGPDAISDTIAAAHRHGLPLVGAGMNIGEARTPVIVERKGTRIGFVAYCSVVPLDAEATEERPGMAPLRATTRYEQFDWQPGTPPRIISEADPNDLEAMVLDIRNLRHEVDVLAVSYHWGIHFEPASIAMYQPQVAYAAIDAGADVILGHHAHILKPIEVYKGKPIFYSMGNFIFDASYSRMQRWNITSFYGFDMDPELPAYGQPVDSQKTMIVKCTVVEGNVKRAAFIPCWINRKVQPDPLPASEPRSVEVLRYMEWMCRNQRIPTKFVREGNEIVIDLSAQSRTEAQLPT